jgi:hypothetical protein
MIIFKSYTGNAMLNNALMTIEALGDLKGVSDITPEILLQLYNDKGLLKLNKRLKSYTMLFTKNGPLHNDKTNGDKIYDALFKTILKDFESDGDKICEVSGLKFNSAFSTVFEKALDSIGISKKDIQKKDTNLSRTWFPLIGGLGSDAQALPQAKFTIQIHPICIAILQFLPLSALLYKGGILLIDSSNFGFARKFVAENQRDLGRRIELTKSTDSIENVRDFSKGNYILKALRILEDKEDFEEVYSDLNLWSFSNSGTGASCIIDRVPNALIQKLSNFKQEGPEVRTELVKILNNNGSAYSFLDALENNAEWWLLYPNVFGSGKKKVEYEGVSVAFLEAYFKETGNTKQIEYAKYLAYLIDKYKSKSFDKNLSDTSAWNENDYKINLYSVLIEATKSGEWNLCHQLQIIDNPEQVPVRNSYYKLHRLIHFYYQKKVFNKLLPTIENKTFEAKIVCEWLIALIQRDCNKAKLIKELTNVQNYISVGYNGILLRSFELPGLDLITIANRLYDENFFLSKKGLNELLRIFFNQGEQESFKIADCEFSQELKLEENALTKKWFADFTKFANDYLDYYFKKYNSKHKTLKLIEDISLVTPDFLYWFRDAIERTNDFLKIRDGNLAQTWSDALLYNPFGEFVISFAKIAIKFSLLKQYRYSLLQQKKTIIS